MKAVELAAASPYISPMTQPLIVDLPHNLGRENARQRIAGSLDKLAARIPGGGTGTIESSWEGDRMHLTVSALGQTVTSRIDVADTVVHAEINLPPMLSLFSGAIRGVLQQEGPKLLK